MHKTGIFTATSFAAVFGAIAFFLGTSVSSAADIDAKKLYMTHCKTCHGENGKPTDLGVGLEARDFTDAAWQAKVTDEQIVSSDIVGQLYGAIVDLEMTRVAGGNLVKVLSWYDNEMGYTNTLVMHLLEVIKYL